jgi:AraC-like DNA-binding protein
MLTAKGLETKTQLWFYHDAQMCVHYFQYVAGRLDCLPHTHDEYNIILCLKGGFECGIRNGHEPLKPGDVLVINPGEVHCNRYGYGPAEASGLTVHLTETSMSRLIDRMRLPIDLGHSSISFLEKVHDPALLSFGEELITELDGRKSGFEMVAQALVVQLMVHLLRHCLHPVVQSPQRSLPRQLPSWQMVRALEYMNSRGKASFSLGELCSSVGTSATRFIQLFKNSVVDGMSPHSFYNHLVVHKARRLLLEPDLSIKAISYELGFQNESHFCKVFRACTGLTPGGFRVSAAETNTLPNGSQLV